MSVLLSSPLVVFANVQRAISCPGIVTSCGLGSRHCETSADTRDTCLTTTGHCGRITLVHPHSSMGVIQASLATESTFQDETLAAFLIQEDAS